jgi:hypothetical protein
LGSLPRRKQGDDGRCGPVAVNNMFRRLGPQKGTLDDITRIEGLVRDRFRIALTDIVLVSQDRGTKPGFPPLEINVIFWKGEKRYRLKIFAPAAQVTERDLPVDWLLPVLEDTGEADCC